MGLATFIIGSGIALLVVAALSFMFYVFHSIALHRALSFCGYGSPWLAWIPVAKQFALADCATHGMGTVPVGSAEVPGWVFRYYWALSYVALIIPYGGWLVSFAIKVFA